MVPALLRDRRDRTSIALTLLPPLCVLLLPHAATVAVAVWWLGNTVAHHATHRRVFVGRRWEQGFALWLTLLLGMPQALWRQRHLAHHAGRPAPRRLPRGFVPQALVLLVAWSALALAAPTFLLTAYLPGLLGGAGLAALHGHYEHRGGITDVHARWWNVLFLNDGYHAAHHALPTAHWHDVPQLTARAHVSPWPPVLRWLRALQPAVWLDRLERVVLVHAGLRARVLAVHRRALAHVLADQPTPRSIAVVGGGLFPRSAILLRERYATASITVVDADVEHLAAARPFLPAGIDERCAFVRDGELGADLVVLPLAFRGDRAHVLATSPVPVLVHDWLWHRRGGGCVVAWWLGKRVWLHRPRWVPAEAIA